ncbi:MAG TPA: 30S ribosomal protein S13 [bacterium]|mgnify:CR=1 FL=1|nr:30S ribosomal protein S13 [bacterium]HPS29349.1 30S ribosomal protein S13 [bacterium]
MVRIAGVDLPRKKRMAIALTYIYGIGRTSAKQILEKAGLDENTKSDDVDDATAIRIRAVIDQDYKVEGDLRKDTIMNIKRLMDLGSYRGRRHRRGLPCRGQRTRTNARTRKGPRRNLMKKKK